MALVNRTVVANYSAHEIKVTNHWFRGAKLFIDEACCAHTRNPFALNKSKSVLRTSFEENEQLHNVDVFAWAPLFKVHLKICIDGDKVGGDDF